MTCAARAADAGRRSGIVRLLNRRVFVYDAEGTAAALHLRRPAAIVLWRLMNEAVAILSGLPAALLLLGCPSCLAYVCMVHMLSCEESSDGGHRASEYRVLPQVDPRTHGDSPSRRAYLSKRSATWGKIMRWSRRGAGSAIMDPIVNKPVEDNPMSFEDRPRDSGRIRLRESTFEFLQRSSRPDVLQRSEWLQAWVRLMPADAQHRLEKELQRDETFSGAYFEVMLNKMFLNLNWDVKYQPVIEGTAKRIDFLVECDGGKFYVEATVCGHGRGGLAGSANQHDAVDKIRERVQTPHSDIHVESLGDLRRTLSTAEVVEPIRALLSKHTPERVRQAILQGGIQRAPSVQIPRDEPALSVSLVPVASPGSDGQVWGPSHTSMCDGVKPLLKSLSDKARDWKQSDFRGIPLLIAVNACHSEFFWYDVEPTIYGDIDEDAKSRSFRQCLSNVSSIIAFDHAVLGNEFAARVQAYSNGDEAIPACLESLLSGMTLGDVLGIDSRQ